MVGRQQQGGNDSVFEYAQNSSRRGKAKNNASSSSILHTARERRRNGGASLSQALSPAVDTFSHFFSGKEYYPSF